MQATADRRCHQVLVRGFGDGWNKYADSAKIVLAQSAESANVSSLPVSNETTNQTTKMKTIEINGNNLGIELNAIERDEAAAWRNGTIILEDGTRISGGGGWIMNEESANLANEEAGIAGGLRQGVSYPNETVAGDFVAYAYGEDESGWQDAVMTALYGAEWEDREEADEEAREVHANIQKALKTLA